ncbi:uncharacterized protein M421DRAFT_142533 [Didymella exigua CBS 183.55]|uniref:BTB domain-containing protein n=1 Tax=Didymella exigua CBS 183.55 TaxID=1150837 RepID=A0A6A5RKG6_9PLEO|nr:uncharacterized protein M421DRAFT_142533 [Didymella exigua CBS 183.55]KAF1928911.1 hypothetical protein M421DRAFT_142533 [Didymella exigua CBS 183.55]
MNGKWEAESRVVSLADDEPDIFGVYVSLVYTGKLPVTHIDTKNLPHDEKKSLLQEEYDDFFRLYALADKSQDTAAKDTEIAAVFEVLEKEGQVDYICLPTFATFVTMCMLYDRKPDIFPARKLVGDMANTCDVESL